MNTLFIFFGGHLNPFYNLTGLYVLSTPYFRRREKELESKISEAFEHDENLYYVMKGLEKPARLKKPNYDYSQVGSKRKAAPDRGREAEPQRRTSSQQDTAAQSEDANPQSEALPFDNFGGSQSSGLSKVIDDFFSSQWFDSFESIAVLFILMTYREYIMPDFVHFISCVVDDEAHFLFVTALWLFFRNFLEAD